VLGTFVGHQYCSSLANQEKIKSSPTVFRF
jgi:hypothetical protein